MYSCFIYSNDDNDASKSKYENLIGFNILEHVWLLKAQFMKNKTPAKAMVGINNLHGLPHDSVEANSGLISASSWTAASHWAALTVNQETVSLLASTFIHLLACVVGQIRTSGMKSYTEATSFGKHLTCIKYYNPHQGFGWFWADASSQAATVEWYLRDLEFKNNTHKKYTYQNHDPLSITLYFRFFDVCWCYYVLLTSILLHPEDWGLSAMISGERWSDNRHKWLKGDQK